MFNRKRGIGYGLRRSGLLTGPKRKNGRARLPHCDRRHGTPEENVAAFIELARRNPCRLSHCKFEEDTWNVTGAVAERAGRPANAGEQLLWFIQARGGTEPRVALPPCWGGRPRGILCQGLVVSIRT